MDTITLQLTPRLSITLAALNRAVIVNMYAQPSEAQPPDLPPGYTHEDALKIEEYKAQFEAYQMRQSSDGSMRVLGAARLAALDFIDEVGLKSEEENYARFLKHYGIAAPSRDDPLSVGYTLYLAAQVAPQDDQIDQVFNFLFRSLGVPSALIAEERKSETTDNRGQAGKRSSKPNKKDAQDA